MGDHQPQPYGGGGQENYAPPQSYAPPQNNDQPQHQNFAPAQHHHVPSAAATQTSVIEEYGGDGQVDAGHVGGGNGGGGNVGGGNGGGGNVGGGNGPTPYRRK